MPFRGPFVIVIAFAKHSSTTVNAKITTTAKFATVGVQPDRDCYSVRKCYSTKACFKTIQVATNALIGISLGSQVAISFAANP